MLSGHSKTYFRPFHYIQEVRFGISCSVVLDKDSGYFAVHDYNKQDLFNIYVHIPALLFRYTFE